MNKIVEAVGVSVNSLWPVAKARAKLIQLAMSDAVLEAGRQGITDPVKIREMMQVARQHIVSGG